MRFFRPIILLFFIVFISLKAQTNTVKDEAYFIRLVDSVRLVHSKYKYKETITLCSRLIEEGEANNSNFARFIAYDLLGTVYTTLGENEKSLQHTKKALEVALETKNDSLIAWANLNMGNAFSKNESTYQKAEPYFKESLNYYKEKKKFEDLYLTYINIIWALLDYDDCEKAIIYLEKAKQLSVEQDINESFKIYIEFLTGKYYYSTKQSKLAEKVLLAVTKSIDKDSLVDIGEYTHAYLKSIYEEKGDYVSAFKNLKKEKYFNELNFEETQQKAIQVAIAKLDLEQYRIDLERAIKDKDASKKRMQLLTAVMGVLLLATIGFFMLFHSRRKFANKLSIKNKELIEAKNQSEKLSRVKSQFFSTVSHELRTPLYGVIGLSSILKEDVKLKDYEEELDSLKFSADYLLALINDVLLLNKMDYQDLELEKVPFQLNALIKSIERSFKFSLQQNKNKLIIDVDDKVPNYLLGSSVRLSQILMNLIGNATKFNENGTIWLTIKLIEKTLDNLFRIEFIVKDNGIGIPIHKQETIFEEFSQVTSNNYSHKGTGLGLPIVKKLLSLHNSNIELKSGLGVGSEFSFILNLEENSEVITNDSDVESSAENVKNTINEYYKNVHILVVDDNKINQKVTQNILAKNNIQSSVANDGGEAIEMTKNNDYSLILMDINMPKVNGIKATKVIRTFNKDIPIIALTAVEMEEIRVKTVEAGMDDLLPKPYGASQFLSAILKNLSKNKTI